MFSLLKPAFSLPVRPHVLIGHASAYNGTLLYPDKLIAYLPQLRYYA